MNQTTAILCIAIYGMIISLLIALKLEISKKLNLNDAKTGSLFTIFMFTGAISVIFISSLIDFYGHKILVIAGFTLVSISALLLSKLKSYRKILIAHILMSFGAMSLVSVGNTLLPHVLFEGNNAPAATNLGNVFYGVGAALTSFSIGMFFKKLGYNKTVSFIAAIFAIPIFFALFTDYPEVKTGFKLSDILTVITNPFVIIAVAANFFASGVENGVGAWVNTLMSRAGYSDKLANVFLSIFFICIMITRLISVAFVNPSNTTTAIALMAIIAAITILLMVLIKSKLVIIVGVILLGLTLGPNVPNIFGYMFLKIDPSIYGTSFGLCFAFGVAGASLFPGLVGLFSKRLTLKRSFFIVNIIGAILLFFVAVFIM